MRLAVRVSLVALLALLSSEAVAGSDIDRAATVGAARGVERFGAIYREGGISAAADAVRACYRSPEAKRGADGLAECAALDVAASVADLQARMNLGVPPYPFFAGAAMESRVSAGLKAAKLPRAARASLDRAILAAMEGPEAGSADDGYMEEARRSHHQGSIAGAEYKAGFRCAATRVSSSLKYDRPKRGCYAGENMD